MLDKNHFKDLLTYALIISLFILAAAIIRPVVFSIIYGVLLGYVSYPLYRWTLKKIKKENLSALLVCFTVSLLILVFVSLVFGSLIGQVINVYLEVQKLDLNELIQKIIPNSVSQDITSTVSGAIATSISTIIGNLFEELNNFIVNLPTRLLQLIIVIFIFFFSLRDGKKAIEYLKSLIPVKKETSEKFFTHFEEITNSVIIGQIVVGILQGIISGVGYFVFGVPNALLLTVITTLVGVIPIIGPWLVWIPIDIYLFATGKSGAGLGLLIYGSILINWIDTLVRPIIVSKRTKINPGIIITGMIGGLFVFGVLGLIIGPLVLSYILLLMELYRKKSSGTESIVFIK